MNERIKKLRKSLDLTQQQFADKIGMMRNTIANYETGRNEPSTAVISLICREFRINEEWLRTGEGNMSIEYLPNDEYTAAASELVKTNDTMAMQMVIEYWKMDEDSKRLFWDFMNRVVNNVNKSDKSETVATSDDDCYPSTSDEFEKQYPPYKPTPGEIRRFHSTTADLPIKIQSVDNNSKKSKAISN